MEDLLEKVRRNTEEIVTQEELKNLIEAKNLLISTTELHLQDHFI